MIDPPFDVWLYVFSCGHFELDLLPPDGLPLKIGRTQVCNVCWDETSKTSGELPFRKVVYYEQVPIVCLDPEYVEYAKGVAKTWQQRK